MESVFVQTETLKIAVDGFFWKIAEDDNLSLFVTPSTISIAQRLLHLRDPLIHRLLRRSQRCEGQQNAEKQNPLHKDKRISNDPCSMIHEDEKWIMERGSWII